ncbi:cytochrome P450 [Sporichthya sp.]|uniref:cytochrome P450 n=1 Tax=Sporichthya sp. TaxID=65475 RepID=UPI00181C3E81|nr:cytochrome P450 [Sporichthya sp.]MBA3741979.1 cytochrome P450 [Sporichthya sp.]
MYQQLHQGQPVVHVPEMGMYLISRYGDVAEALRDDETYSSCVASKLTSGLSMNPQRDSVDAVLATGYPHVDSLAWLDPPQHTRQRQLIVSALNARRVKLLEGEISRTASALVESWDEDATIEYMTAFSQPLAIAMIAAILGLTQEETARLPRWSEAVMNRIGKPLSEEEDIAEATQVVEFQHFMAALVETRRKGGHDDFLGDVVAANLVGDDPISMAELLSLLLTLLVAGHDTSASLMGSLLYELVRRPELMQRVRADRSLISRVIEETLRLQAPVSVFTRVTTCPVKVADTEIAADELVMLMFGSANVDAEQFADPLAFDIDRPQLRSHVAFGGGIHFCPGAVLAKREAEIGLNLLLDRFSDIRLAPGATPEFDSNFRMRRLLSLDIVARV